MLNNSQEREGHKKHKNGQKQPKMPPSSEVGDTCELFIYLLLPQQCLKDPYAKFLKKIFSHSEKMVEHTEKQTNRQTEIGRLI